MTLLTLLGWGLAFAAPPPAQAGDPPAVPPPAKAGDPPAVPPDPHGQEPHAEEIADLQARIAALEAAKQAAEAEQFLRDAEALAAPVGPPPPQASARASFNAMNPGITAFGDLVGQLGVNEAGVKPGSTMYLRSLELEFRADVDPFAKADAVLAFEQEAPPLEGGPGEGFGAEPEEAYIELVALPAHLSGRVGKFRVPFGVANRTHPHDLPWVDVPGAMEGLGEEGYNDTGGTLSFLLPAGPLGITLTGGAFSGEPFDPDGAFAAPAGLGRLELFGGFGNVNVGVGASVIEDFGQEQNVAGGDFTFRWKNSERRSVVLIAEAIRGVDGEIGGYAAAQVQPKRNTYLGFREDFLPDGLQHNFFLSYYTSEFLRLRIGGGYTPDSNSSGRGDLDALGQLTFVWGSHPVEPWWVNK